MGRLLFRLLLVGCCAAGLALAAQKAGALDGVEQTALSARFAVRGAQPNDDVAVIGIDDKTFSQLRRRWPFPRSLHGKAVARLRAAGVREIAYDVQFTEPTSPREDLALYDALGRAGGAVLSSTESDAHGHTGVLGGDANLAAIHSRAGATNLPDASGAVIDRFPYAIGRLTSFAVRAAGRAGGPRLARSAFAGGGAAIDFRGPPGTIPTYSFSDLVDGHIDPRLLRGRIVVVGATSPTLQDLHATPTSSSPMPGPEVQANAIWSALHGLPLRRAPGWLNWLAVVAMAFAVPLLRVRARVGVAALLAPVLAIAFAGAAVLAFGAGTILWVTAPLLALALATLGTVVASHLAESDARRTVTRANDVLEQRVRERTSELRTTQLEILERLAGAAEWRDEDTGEHVVRIGTLAERLALAAGVDPVLAETMRHASTAHDIGKIGIPDRILLKPGPLSAEERAHMQRHTVIGAQMLAGSDSELLQLAEEIALTHHERWDGTGYPNRLRGEDIPLAGRICGVVDVFDALLSPRPYKAPWPLEQTLAEMAGQRARQFDPDLVDRFLEIAPALYAELGYAERAAGEAAPPLAA